jgi:hypothetical protein
VGGGLRSGTGEDRYFLSTICVSLETVLLIGCLHEVFFEEKTTFGVNLRSGQRPTSRIDRVESKGDSARAFTPAEKRSWSIGGMLLVLAGSVGTLLRPVDGQLPIMILSDLLYGAALAMFAFGPRSVTGHRALGTIALVGLALSSFISTALDPFLASTPESLAL